MRRYGNIEEICEIAHLRRSSQNAHVQAAATGAEYP